MKKILSLILVSALGGALTLGTYLLFFDNSNHNNVETTESEMPTAIPVNYNPSVVTPVETTDFAKIAKQSVNAVVHVKNVSVAQSNSNSLFEFFYGQQSQSEKTTVIGSGSGVIISSDGYIITNNHVIKGAKKIEITLNNKTTYNAKVIGTDEGTDIALLKINVIDMPYLTIGDSDNLQVGEWVLAVGNPFNLTSTVTAGIVSAKARNLHLSNNNNRIESFIQTDAAVNPGNSGGALVNVRGELIGINTAISSRTGSYIGYSFAVPSNIAKKVVEDILEFGNVQRAYLGINYQELDSEKANKYGLSSSEGVIITRIMDYGAAKDADLKANDIITNVDHIKISKFSDLQGFLGSKRPGDQIDITVLRDNTKKIIPVKLKNQFGKLKFGKTDFSNYFIGELKPIPKKDVNKFDIDYGVKIIQLKNEILYKTYGIESGDIILAIEDKKVSTVDEVEQLLKKHQNKKYIVLRMLTQEGKIGYVRLKES
ncbi:MAG: Do family serine endopeptidase [Flavobacteriaceae bacterium]|nr:Do family serine endopeptidase [Flavobacteriaceae bacterium]